MKRILSLALILALAGAAVRLLADPEITSSVPAKGLEGGDYPAHSKISLEQAVKTALKASPKGNKSLSASLTANTHADGTSYLIWDCDTVGKRGDVTAVFIDPATGKVLGTQREDWAMGEK